MTTVYGWFLRFRREGMFATINHHLVMQDRQRPPDHAPARVRPCDMFMNFLTEMRWATMTRSTLR